MSTNAVTIGPSSPSAITPRTSRIGSNTKQGPHCPECSCPNTIRKGKRRNRMRVLQVYQCSECLHRFTAGDAGKNKTYPLNAILETVSTFNRGHSVSETQALIRRRLHIHIPERTISSWIAEHRKLATYARLRPDAKKTFAPNQIVRSYTLEHRQVYHFQVHQAKLDMLTRAASTNIHGLENLEIYFDTVGPTYPHHLFTSTVERSSKFSADFRPRITRKENHATQLAALALPTSPNNKKRHETLQRFMLINDSVTVAVEVPVYLMREDVSYYRSRGFNLNVEAEVITGHIDFLQVRNGYVHILDYKPEARKEKHAHVRLTIYALALARRP